jgi:ATP-dependent DNA ligase
LFPEKTAVAGFTRRHKLMEFEKSRLAARCGTACKLGLEGIVSKRFSAPYRSGPSRD